MERRKGKRSAGKLALALLAALGLRLSLPFKPSGLRDRDSSSLSHARALGFLPF